jgi:hypothetical protein
VEKWKGVRERTIFELDKLIDLINRTLHTLLRHHACRYLLGLKKVKFVNKRIGEREGGVTLSGVISNKDPSSAKVILLYSLEAERRLCSITALSSTLVPSLVMAIW